ncbi:response regulator [Pseudomonadota bacterium]|nr:response regulator [Pseudomonadota bacterium]
MIKDTRYIVIVDDQSTGRTILERIILQISDNIKVVAFDEPAPALKWLDNNFADLIVTDYMMPVMNGIKFIQNIRSKPEYENVPIMMITVSGEKAVRYDALEAGATAFLTRPIDQFECRTSCRNLLQLHEQHLIIQDRADWLARQVDMATKKIIVRERESIICLSKAGEYKDEDTGNHVIRMAKYSRLIAEATGKFSSHECEDLEYAAPMHDIGKIGIPDSILLKKGKLDEKEWEIMKKHSEIGSEILSSSSSKYMQIAAIIALNHHERMDGKGYPNNLEGNEIPLIARVVAVADVYDALVTSRPYKSAWKNEDALAYIKQQAGTHFDPICVDAFFKRIDDVNIIRNELSD